MLRSSLFKALSDTVTAVAPAAAAEAVDREASAAAAEAVDREASATLLKDMKIKVLKQDS